MNDTSAPVSHDELHSFVDGQLDAARVPALLVWLQGHPEDAAQVAQWQAQRLELRRLARSLPVGETPATLTDVVLHAAAGQRRHTQWQQAAAVLLLVAASTLGGRYWGQTQNAGLQASAAPSSPAFVREAVAAHVAFVPEKRHPVEVAASDEAHLLQWLSRRLGAPLKLPTLAERGYRLLGGRLLPGDGTPPRAQFMYENAQGARVTLYVAVFAPGQAPAQTAFSSVRSGNEESFYWVDDRFGYALSTEGNRAELMALAREVYGQLER